MDELIMTKRRFLAGAGGVLGAIGLGGLAGCAREAEAAHETFEIMRTEAEWRARLTPAQYAVLRDASTEKPRSSSLNAEKRAGIYRCAGCALPLFDSRAKFESGTGWPSFAAPIRGATRTRPDRGLLTTRTEVHCRRCGGHIGHVFDDGPQPTGQRWCMNGVAMEFVPV